MACAFVSIAGAVLLIAFAINSTATAPLNIPTAIGPNAIASRIITPARNLSAAAISLNAVAVSPT
jgi:small neutral amino acid transporter SnatA (MarC family)